MNKFIKTYAAIRLISLTLMGAAYAKQDLEDFHDDLRQIIVAPKSTGEEKNHSLTSSLSPSPQDQPSSQERHPLRILALGGGGTRGLGTAEILCALETHLQNTTGKSLHEFFDVIVGTSTGGIQAIGLSMGLSAQELKELYQKEAKEIFKQKGWGQWLMGGLWGPTYDTEGLQNTIKKHMGDKKLREAETFVGVTVYDDKERRTHLLTNLTPKEDTIDYKRTEIPAGNINVVDAATATSAAPTYFAKKKISDEELLGNTHDKGTKYNYIDGGISVVDGGVSTNNPEALGKGFATNLLRQGYFADTYNGEIQLISISTGKSKPHVIGEKGGIFGLGNPLNFLPYFMDAAEEQAHATLAEEMEEGENYFHLQPTLSRSVKLDSTNEEDLNMIIQASQEVTKTDYYKRMVEMLCKHSISTMTDTPLQKPLPPFLKTQNPLPHPLTILQPQTLVAA